MTPIIRVAEAEAGAVEDPSDLDDTIRELISDVSVTIDEAYEDSVEIVVEADRLQKKVNGLVKSFRRLWNKANAGEQGPLDDLARSLIASLEEIIDG